VSRDRPCWYHKVSMPPSLSQRRMGPRLAARPLASGVDQVDIDALRDYCEDRFLNELEQQLRSRVNESLPELIPFNQQVHQVLSDTPPKHPSVARIGAPPAPSRFRTFVVSLPLRSSSRANSNTGQDIEN
jgi:hypothetical protein